MDRHESAEGAEGANANVKERAERPDAWFQPKPRGNRLRRARREQ